MPTINLHLGDNMEAMRQMPDKCYDLAIVDPPYGIDLANMNMGIGKSKKASKAHNRKWKAKDWDKSIPEDEYFEELQRVSINQIIWGGNYFDLPPTMGIIIWDKEIPDGMSFSDFELAWSSFSRAAKMFRYSTYLGKKEKFHPTQKPVALYKWLLKNYAKKGDKILDTHLGSGSIAIACYDMGFDLEAWEIDNQYFDAAVKRYNNHISQLQLF